MNKNELEFSAELREINSIKNWLVFDNSDNTNKDLYNLMEEDLRGYHLKNKTK